MYKNPMPIIFGSQNIIMRVHLNVVLLSLFFFQRLIKLITPNLMDKEANQKALLGDLREKSGDEILLTSTL